MGATLWPVRIENAASAPVKGAVDWVRFTSLPGGAPAPSESRRHLVLWRGKGLCSAHAEPFNAIGQRVALHLDCSRRWVRRHIASRMRRDTRKFHSFRGPHALTIVALLADASEYVLVGLEPVGTFSLVEAAVRGQYLAEVRAGLRPFTPSRFFRTVEPTKQPEAGRILDSALPLLFVRLRRMGHVVQELSWPHMNSNRLAVGGNA